MLKQLIDAICFRLINGPLSAPALPEFQISKLEIGPQDFLVVRFRQRLLARQMDSLRANLEGILPNKNKVLIFEGEVDLSVLAHQVDRSPIAA